jgi:hypothetical protein
VTAGETGAAPEQRSLKEQLAASKQIVKVAQARAAKLVSFAGVNCFWGRRIVKLLERTYLGMFVFAYCCAGIAG